MTEISPIRGRKSSDRHSDSLCEIRFIRTVIAGFCDQMGEFFHEEELMAVWERVRQYEGINKIKPLD